MIRFNRGVVLMVAVAAQWSCSRPADVVVTTRVIPFAALVQDAGGVTLEDRDKTGLRVISAALTMGSEVVVLDRARAEARVFDRARGSLTRVVGRSGDEEGDLRRPFAIARLDSAGYAIFDLTRSVLSFRDARGTTVNEVSTPGFLTGLASVDGENRVVMVGELRGAKFGGAAKGKTIHEFDASGELVASYGTPEKPASDWASRFKALVVASVGNTVITAAPNSTQLRLYDRRTHEERTVDLAPGWLKPLEWPSDKILERGRSSKQPSQLIAEWANAQRLVSGIVAVGTQHAIVTLRGSEPNGTRTFNYYVVVDSTGRTLAVTGPTSAQIVGSEGDTIQWIERDTAGRPSLHSGRLALN
jgi:hypothetical protein